MDIYVQSHKTDIYKKNVINMGNKLCNKMPDYIKEMDNYTPLRKSCNHFFYIILFTQWANLSLCNLYYQYFTF